MPGHLAQLPWKRDAGNGGHLQPPQPGGRRGVREDQGVYSEPADFDLSGAGESEAAALRGHNHPESECSTPHWQTFCQSFLKIFLGGDLFLAAWTNLTEGNW